MEVRCRNTGVQTALLLLTADKKFNFILVTSCGNIKGRTEMEHVHPTTVYHYDRLVNTTRRVNCVKSKPEQKRKMSTKDTGPSSSPSSPPPPPHPPHPHPHPHPPHSSIRPFILLLSYMNVRSFFGCKPNFLNSAMSRELMNLATHALYMAMRY